MGENLDGAPDVVLHQLELPSDVLCELPDVQIAVHEEDAYHRRGEEVRQVVRHHSQFIQLQLVLCVDSVQLLVDRLELLCGALQLLVGGEQFLIGRLELAVDGLEALYRRPEVALGDGELMLQLGDALGRSGVEVVLLHSALQLCAVVLQEEDGDELGVILPTLWSDGLDTEVDDSVSRGAFNGDRGIGEALVLAAHHTQPCGESQTKVLVEHAEDVQRRLSLGKREIVAVGAEEVHDVVVRVDDDRWRQELLEEARVEGLLLSVVAGADRRPDACRSDRMDVGHAEGRRSQVVDLGLPLVDVDLLSAAYRLEDADVLSGSLALAQKEVAVVLQR